MRSLLAGLVALAIATVGRASPPPAEATPRASAVPDSVRQRWQIWEPRIGHLYTTDPDDDRRKPPHDKNGNDIDDRNETAAAMKFTAQAPWRGKGIFRRVKSNRDKAKALVVPRLVSPGGIIRASVGPPDNTIPGFAAVLDSTGAPLAWPIVSRIEDAWTTRGWRVPDDFAGHSFVVRIIRPGADTLYAPVIVAPSTPPH